MEFWGDDRAQAIQIGAVLLFGILIISFSTYQAFVVPNQNERIEFNHNQDVQEDLQDVRNAIVSTLGGGVGESVSVSLGTRFPSRAVARNPGPPTGTIRTVGTGNASLNLTIRNATADGEVGDFWNGSEHVYNTGWLEYQPNYKVYQSAPVTTYENSILFNRNRDGTRVQSGQRLIDGRTINLVTLNGSVSQTGVSTFPVDVRAISSSTRTVSVTNESHPLTIATQTRLDEQRWQTLLDDEEYVESVSVDPDGVAGEYSMLEIDLQAGETYSLRMAKVGVGSSVTEPDEGYVTAISGDGESIGTGQTQRLVAEVRDEYNNPISGTLVNATVLSGGGSVSPENETTDSDGRVAFTYTAPSSETTATIEVNVSKNPTEIERAVYEVSVTSEGNAESAYDLSWITDDISNQQGVKGCFEANNTCLYNRSIDDNILVATAGTEPVATFANVDFATNDSSVISDFSPSESTTDENGEVSTEATISARGVATVHASTTQNSDSLSLRVVGESAGDGNNPPTVIIDSTQVRAVGSSGQYDIDVTFTATDPDADLDRYEVTVYASSTQFFEIDSTEVTGGFETGQHTVTLRDNSAFLSQPYYVVVEVEDSSGNTDSDAKLT